MEEEKFLHGIRPRAYQQNIFETACKHNTLVVLPTGMGKSLIGVMLALHRLEKYPKSKILILAPTRPLAAQWLDYFRKHTRFAASMELFTGKICSEKRKKLWQDASIIFSTPECIRNDIKKNFISLKNVSMLCIDECHRCIKNYAYAYVAQNYLKTAENQRLLGLTASPGSDPVVIREICKNLGIEAVESRTRESPDVVNYIQKLSTKIIKVELPQEFIKIREMLNEIYKKKIDELKNRKLLFVPATKKNLLELQKRIINAIASGNRNFNLLAGSSACAQAIKLQHALELIETQGISILYNYMQDLFEQARKDKSKAVRQLVKQPSFNKAYVLLNELKEKGIEHPKLERLKEIISEMEKNPKMKMIIFSQYRDTVTRICKELNNIEGINARVFVGQARKGNSEAEKGLTQQEQQEIIKDFSLGKINILVATSIGEEGLDLPEVSCVVFYEPIPSAIRKIQRAGRTARLRPGKLFILVTKKTRDEAYYWAAFQKEKKMYGILEGFNEKLKKKAEEKKQTSLKKFF